MLNWQIAVHNPPGAIVANAGVYDYMIRKTDPNRPEGFTLYRGHYRGGDELLGHGVLEDLVEMAEFHAKE